MSDTPTRTARPRLWTTLTLAGTAATMATGLPAADLYGPGHAFRGDATLWLAQAEGGEAGEAGEAVPAEGGEGGEGGAPESASADAAYLTELGKLEAHLVAAAALYVAGAEDDAVALALHPEAEFLPELRERFEERGAEDLTPFVEDFATALVARRAEDATLNAALDAIAAAERATGASAADRYAAILYLVRDAAAEYGSAFEDGALEDRVALEEARGFLDAAVTLIDRAADGEVGADVAGLIETARSAFPSLPPEAGFVPDASILFGAAARIEVAALRLR